jgi:hypothetical protein
MENNQEKIYLSIDNVLITYINVCNQHLQCENLVRKSFLICYHPHNLKRNQNLEGALMHAHFFLQHILGDLLASSHITFPKYDNITACQVGD